MHADFLSFDFNVLVKVNELIEDKNASKSLILVSLNGYLVTFPELLFATVQYLPLLLALHRGTFEVYSKIHSSRFQDLPASCV